MSSAADMLAALADEGVHDVLLRHGGTFDLAAAARLPVGQRPQLPVDLRREVTLRGELVDGQPTHVQGGMEMGLVRVLEGGVLRQKASPAVGGSGKRGGKVPAEPWSRQRMAGAAQS